jgi:hypothetical protein
VVVVVVGVFVTGGDKAESCGRKNDWIGRKDWTGFIGLNEKNWGVNSGFISVPVLKVAELSILPLGNLTPLFSFPFPKSN